MVECVVYLHTIGSLTEHSPLMNIPKWKSSTAFNAIKKRPYDIERCEVELSYNYLADYDYAYIEYNGTPAPAAAIIPCVYRIVDIRQGGSIRSVADSAYTDRINGSAILTLELDALATWYVNKGGGLPTIFGRWSRLPMLTMVEPFQIRPSQMARNKILASLPEIEHNTHVGDRIVFVKITANMSGVLTHLCAFCSVENTDQYLDGGLAASNNQYYVYPSLKAIMNDLPLILGVSSGDIYDVSVSEDCPVAYTFTAEAGYDGRDIIVIDDAAAVLRNFNVGGTTYHVMLSDIHDLIMDWQEKTVLLQLDGNETVMGQVQLIGSDNTVVTTIDTRYFSYNSVSAKWELTLIYRLKMDVGSMYTELQLPDGNVLRFTEGRLPWVGSAWADYVATQRNYDRTIAVVEKDKAQTEMAAGITTSLANGVFTSVFSGGAGAGTAVLGAVGNVANYYEGERARANELAAKEGLMKSTPGTLYSPEYGVTYLNLMFNSEPMRQICLAMPIDVSAQDFTDYINTHGYPVTDIPLALTSVHLVNAVRGFIQATQILTADVGGKTGVFFRALEKQLRRGTLFHLIT